MNPVFTDAHAHLAYIGDRLGLKILADLLAVYASSWEAGEKPLIVDPGVDPDDFNPRAARFASLPFVRLAAGIWPSVEALAGVESALSKLEPALADPRCSAVGECGPDYHHMHADRTTQMELFEGQLHLARRYAKPVIVHSRDAAADTAEAIGSARLETPVIIHCYSYGPSEIGRFLDLGCHISFAGNVTYKKAGALAEACRLVPLGRLLVETDAPYMNPSPGRGKPSTCLDIVRTYEFISGLRHIGVEMLAEAVSANTRTIFS